jgi:hypothetical protein
MYLDKDDVLGLILFTALVLGIAGVLLLVATWDLPPGVSLGRRGFTLFATHGRPGLKPYALACLISAAVLGGFYRFMKRPRT